MGEEIEFGRVERRMNPDGERMVDRCARIEIIGDAGLDGILTGADESAGPRTVRGGPTVARALDLPVLIQWPWWSVPIIGVIRGVIWVRWQEGSYRAVRGGGWRGTETTSAPIY
jgi:hypothetical protein